MLGIIQDSVGESQNYIVAMTTLPEGLYHDIMINNYPGNAPKLYTFPLSQAMKEPPHTFPIPPPPSFSLIKNVCPFDQLSFLLGSCTLVCVSVCGGRWGGNGGAPDGRTELKGVLFH